VTVPAFQFLKQNHCGNAMDEVSIKHSIRMFSTATGDELVGEDFSAPGTVEFPSRYVCMNCTISCIFTKW
jgi:hypothetical protein